MIIGLVTEPKTYTRKILIKRFLGIRICDNIKNPSNPFELYAELLPFSNKRLEAMSCRRLRRLLDKQLQRLKKRGVTKFMLSDYLYRLCLSKNIDTSLFSNGHGEKLFLMILPLCIRQTAKKHNINLLLSSICISDTKMDRISEYLMRELCFDTKKLVLCTDNTVSAKKFCESFYDETGLWVEVISAINSDTDIVIDVNRCELRIGRDLFVRDAGFGFDFCGYKINQCDIASLLQSPDTANIRWIFSYEKISCN